jgi:hypothetical protein
VGKKQPQGEEIACQETQARLCYGDAETGRMRGARRSLGRGNVRRFPARGATAPSQFSFYTGKLITKAVPRPGSLSALMAPPWAFTSDRAMASPSPDSPSESRREPSPR